MRTSTVAEKRHPLYSPRTLELVVADVKSRWDPERQAEAEAQPMIPMFPNFPFVDSCVRVLAAKEYEQDSWLAKGTLIDAGLPVLKRFLTVSRAGERLAQKPITRKGRLPRVRALKYLDFFRGTFGGGGTDFVRCLSEADTKVLKALARDYCIAVEVVAVLAMMAGIAQSDSLLCEFFVRLAEDELVALRGALDGF